MPLTRGFNHVATLTTDLDRLAKFYADAFEATISFQMEREGDHPRMFILDLGGGAALNAFEVPSDEIIGEQRRQGGRGAIDHFALAVESRDELDVTRRAHRGRRWRRGRGATARQRVVVVLPRHRRDGAGGLRQGRVMPAGDGERHPGRWQTASTLFPSGSRTKTPK